MTETRNIYIRKLQDASITIHQAFRLLLKPHVTGNQQIAAMIRTGLKAIRADEAARMKWIRVLETRHPHLGSICVLLWNLNADELRTVRRHKQEEIDFWRVLFEHMIRVCFIHPEIFMSKLTPLGDAIQIIRSSWVDFVALYTVLDIESQLTEETLKTRDNESLLTVNQGLQVEESKFQQPSPHHNLLSEIEQEH